MAAQSCLLRNAAGRFTDVTKEQASALSRTGLVTAAVWTDVNDDDWSDLVVAHEWGPVRIFVNQQGSFVERTEEAGTAPFTGWWNGVAARDLDGDQDIDLVVTNFGLNTKYHASPEKPALLYYGDFENNGRMRLVEAEFEDEKLFPIRGKSCSTHAMPFLAEKFETYREFALAELSQLYTENCLSESHRFAATTLESGVMLNDGSGRFQFKPFPRLAQASPGFGVSVTEVNGDGVPDVFTVQNFHGPQPETGHLDGGLSLLLRGIGDGTFEPVMPTASGLVVSGDAKSLVALDMNSDGWQDWVVGVNDDVPVGFLGVPRENEKAIAVRLIGPPGNPTGIGSRITVRSKSGPTQTSDVSAGSGYLSQSSPVLMFGGPAAQVQSITVRWPDGGVSTTVGDGSSAYEIRTSTDVAK